MSLWIETRGGIIFELGELLPVIKAPDKNTLLFTDASDTMIYQIFAASTAGNTHLLIESTDQLEVNKTFARIRRAITNYREHRFINLNEAE